jgi:hypothetical protein
MADSQSVSLFKQGDPVTVEIEDGNQYEIKHVWAWNPRQNPSTRIWEYQLLDEDKQTFLKSGERFAQTKLSKDPHGKRLD